MSALRSAGWRSATRQAGIFLLGALPRVVARTVVQNGASAARSVGRTDGGRSGAKLFNGGRWLKVAGGFLKQAWEVHLLPLGLLAVTCGLLRLRPRQERSYAPSLAVLLIVLAGYFAIFLVTKDDLDWLFATAPSIASTCTFGPALVLAVFLLAATPRGFRHRQHARRRRRGPDKERAERAASKVGLSELRPDGKLKHAPPRRTARQDLTCHQTNCPPWRVRTWKDRPSRAASS